MSVEAFWKEMWERKGSFREMFSNGVLLVDCQASRWNGNHPVEENSTKYIIPAGTKVLITVISRFGHVGIRDYDIDKEEHGYVACVQPEQLKDLVFLSDGGTGWKWST